VVAEVSSRPWSIGVTGMPEAIPALDLISLVRLDSDDSGQEPVISASSRSAVQDARCKMQDPDRFKFQVSSMAAPAT